MVDIIHNSVHVAEIHRIMMENCATDPLFCSLNIGDRQTFAVVKFMNNPQGNLSLINEFCGARICQILGISLPQSGICEINRDTILDDEFRQKMKGFSCHNYGPAFYSEYIYRSTPFSAPLLSRVDVRQLVNMMLFDHLVFNRDRHDGNVLFEIGKGFCFYLVDHSHIFKNDCIWDRYCFSQGIAENDFLDESIYESNQEIYRQIILYASPSRAMFEDACKTFQQELTPQVLHSIIGQIPSEWAEGHEEDVLALEGYLNYRVSHLPQITDLIIKRGGL